MIFFYVCVFLQMFEHRESTQAVSLVVSWKYKEMYGRILKSLDPLNLFSYWIIVRRRTMTSYVCYGKMKMGFQVDHTALTITRPCLFSRA